MLSEQAESVRERLWISPPRDRRIGIVPPDGRALAAAAVARHIERELASGRPFQCIVRDRFVEERIDEFDGRALPPHCLPEDDA